jgi:hypothetical protein
MVDGMTATGSWEERTSPTGYYKGAVYRGALQFLVAPSGGQLTCPGPADMPLSGCQCNHQQTAVRALQRCLLR